MKALLIAVRDRMRHLKHKDNKILKEEICAGKEEHVSVNMEHREKRKRQVNLLPHANLQAVSKIRDSWYAYGQLCYLVDITIVNDSTTVCGSWESDLYFNQPVKKIDYWNCNCNIDSCRVHISSTDHNGGLGIGDSYTMAGIILSSEVNLKLMK